MDLHATVELSLFGLRIFSGRAFNVFFLLIVPLGGEFWGLAAHFFHKILSKC
jgi:hypothetical protein